MSCRFQLGVSKELKMGRGVPSTLANLTRLTDQDGEKIPKCAKGNKKVQALDSAARAEDMLEKERRCNLLCFFKLGSWNCFL